MYVDVYIVVTCHVNRFVKDVLELYVLLYYSIHLNSLVHMYVHMWSSITAAEVVRIHVRHFATSPHCVTATLFQGIDCGASR